MTTSTLKKLMGAGGLLIGAVVATWLAAGDRVRSGGPGPVSGPIPAPPPSTLAPPPDLKIAFIGDTGAGPDFEHVLALIREERSDAVVHLGDAIYDETPEQFWSVVDRVLGHDHPYFLAQGNHDLAAWPAMAAHALHHVQSGAGAEAPSSLLDPRFAFFFRGVSLLFLRQDVADDDPRYIIDRFGRDEHIWKICAWHKNQESLQVGGKSNEMGWGVYESCRQMGALVQTGHEHSYHRTRTLADMVDQQVAADCSERDRLCVRPGAVPVFVSGLGGRSIRDQRRCLPAAYPYGCKGEWGFVYTNDQAAQFGALFLVFHRDGDPRKARGYFKNVAGQVVDEFELRAR